MSGVETLPSFGLVMSRGDFVVLTRLNGSVPLNGRSGEQPAEQPCASLSKSSQLANEQPQRTGTNELSCSLHCHLFDIVFANNFLQKQFFMNVGQVRRDATVETDFSMKDHSLQFPPRFKPI